MNAQVNQNNVVWPVPGRTKINESDVPIEGDGHFGYTRTNADGSPKFHAGIDIEGRRGDSVVSFKEGKVTFAGEVPGYGYSIMVDHGNGVGSFYAHLDSISVKEGQTVAAGAKIGTLGATGNASQTVAAGGDPHLHFEIVEGYNPNLPLSNSNGQAVDPMKYLNGAQQIGSPSAPSTPSAPASNATLLREGDSGDAVRRLQEALNKNGAQLEADGKFGPLTRAEVERYQASKALMVDGIAGPKTWGALAQTQQQAPTQPTQPTQPSNGASADFGAQLRSQDLKNTSIYLAIGLAEGTINRNGQPNSAYFGHGDPGNGALNRGFGSYQVQQHPKGEALTAPEADRVQADRLAGQWNRIDKALNEAGFKPGPTRDLIAANALDAWNQAPLTFEDRYGLMNKQQLSELKQKVDSGTSPRDAIVDWRAQSYRDNSGRLDAPGLGNSMERVREDQARRIDAIAEGLQLRPPVREQAQANVQPQVAAQTVPAATAGAVAATASVAATVAAPVTDRTLITHPDHPGHKWHEQALAIVDKLQQGTVSAENRDKAAALIALQVMDDQRLSKMAGVETIGKGLIAVSDQQSVRAANSTVGMVNINGLEGMNLRELSQQIEKLPEAAKREPQIVAPVAPTQPQDVQNLDPKRNNPVLLA